jgi:hypothetical protein
MRLQIVSAKVPATWRSFTWLQLIHQAAGIIKGKS